MPSKEEMVDHAKRLERYWKKRTEQRLMVRRLRDLDPDTSIANDPKRPLDLAKLQRVIVTDPRSYWNWAIATLANEPFKWRSPPNATILSSPR